MKKNGLRKAALFMIAILTLQYPIYVNATIKPEAKENRNNEIESIEKSLSQEEIELYSEPEKQLKSLKIEEQKDLSRRSATRPQTLQKIQEQEGGNKSYQEVLPKSIKDFVPEKIQEIERIKEEAILDAETSAEEIRQLDRESFDAAVREILDIYYEDIEHIDHKRINTFVQALGEKAGSIAEGYKAAFEERNNAGSLDYETEQILVAFKEGTSYEEIQGIVDCLSGEMEIIDGTNKELPDYMAEGKNCIEELIAKIGIGIGQTVGMAKEAMEEIDCIKAVDFNNYMSLDEASYKQANDPGKGEQYYLDQVNVDGAWNVVTDTIDYDDYKFNKVVIAIIDTGFDIWHDELKNILSEKSITTCEPNMVSKYKNLFECQFPYFGWHGSHVAGIIAAETNNNAGMVGITSIYNLENDQLLNMCEIIGINAGGMAPNGDIGISTEGSVGGIEYAMEHGADVINMSYGDYKENTVQEEALKKAHEAGIVLVAAAGNKNTDAPHYPSDSEHVISVSWLYEGGEMKHDESNYGANVDISAPGTDIYSCYVEDSRMGRMNGTSMAAPMVTAAVGLMKAVNQQLTPEEIETILYTTATDLYPPAWDKETGYGRLNIGKAVLQAKIKAAASHKKTQYDAKLLGYDMPQFILSFDVNPIVDFYEIYRSEVQWGYGMKINTIKRKDITGGKVVFCDTNMEDGKTYYYTVAGRIKNEEGNGYAYTEFLGEENDNHIKVECVSPEITISKASSSNYCLSLSYKADSQLCTIERSESELFDTDLMSIPVFRMSFDDQTAEKGKGYYYRAFVSYEKDNVKYFSKYSNIVYIMVRDMPQPPSVLQMEVGMVDM